MSRNLHLGAASISFSQPLYIESAASIVSQKEADGPLGDFFDLICKDPMFGCGTWESAESTLQKETATLVMNKAGLTSKISTSCLPEIFLPRQRPHASVPPDLESPFTDFTAPAPPWENPCLSAALLSPPVSAPGSYVPPPAILQVRKKNFVFLWDTVISGPFLPPGL